jgi:hypothetical protein
MEADMSDLTSGARLIDASEIRDRPHRIPAAVPREELQEALRGEDMPELILDIARRDNGDVEAHTLRVALTQQQLEEMLRGTSGEQVTLVFDADELEQALLEDVEAHGVREKTAAVLTVAAMAAGVAASAQPAAASAGTVGAAGSSIEMVSDAASSGVPQTPELISDAASSGPVEASTAPELISDAASSGPGTVLAAATGPELISDAASTGTLSPSQAAALAGNVSTRGSDDSGLSSSEIAGAAAGGGLALLITAAGFAIRGKRRHLQPS